ncbi:MAG TPA: DUF2336 domain-containing protein [Alphaproteobacteria bacterium]
MDESRQSEMQRLCRLAERNNPEDRAQLFGELSEIFIQSDQSLVSSERQLMVDVLGTLIHDIEMEIRQDLAKRLAELPSAPRELVVMLANDEIDVARPLLTKSGVLSDPDLIEIVRHRTREHRLAIALQKPLGEHVADAILDHGEADVIEELLNNPDAVLSQRALEYLVAESLEVARYQKPLLNRPDLPAKLAHRMFWWVSAVLRQHIVDRFRIDEELVSSALENSAKRALSSNSAPSVDELAQGLVERLEQIDELNERFLVQALRGGNVTAFTASFARLCRLDLRMARRVIFEPGGEPLAVACKSIGIDRSNFATIFLLTRKGESKVMPSEKLQNILAFYDSLGSGQAATMLAYWRADEAADSDATAVAAAKRN